MYNMLEGFVLISLMRPYSANSYCCVLPLTQRCSAYTGMTSYASTNVSACHRLDFYQGKGREYSKNLSRTFNIKTGKMLFNRLEHLKAFFLFVRKVCDSDSKINSPAPECVLVNYLFRIFSGACCPIYLPKEQILKKFTITCLL